MLYNVLGKRQKIVFIFDDLWEYFILDKVGIIFGQNSCKIIMSFCFLEVCRKMGCGEFVVLVKIFFENEVWKLIVDGFLNYEVLVIEVK